MSGFYINEISFLQLIGLYWRIIGMCMGVVLYCRFCGRSMIKYCFLPFLSNLLILTVTVEVFVDRWRVYGRRLMFCLWMEL